MEWRRLYGEYLSVWILCRKSICCIKMYKDLLILNTKPKLLYLTVDLDPSIKNVCSLISCIWMSLLLEWWLHSHGIISNCWATRWNTDHVTRNISLCSPSLSHWNSLICQEICFEWYPGWHYQWSCELTYHFHLNEDDLFHVISNSCKAWGYDQWQKGSVWQYQTAYWQRSIPFWLKLANSFNKNAVWEEISNSDFFCLS